MTFRDVTRTVIDHVEKVSGCPVVVSEDAVLKTLAASRIARGENRIHAISFNPSVVREPDYLVCYQSGFILRLFAVPAAERVDLASTAEERQLVRRLPVLGLSHPRVGWIWISLFLGLSVLSLCALNSCIQVRLYNKGKNGLVTNR